MQIIDAYFCGGFPEGGLEQKKNNKQTNIQIEQNISLKSRTREKGNTIKNTLPVDGLLGQSSNDVLHNVRAGVAAAQIYI